MSLGFITSTKEVMISPVSMGCLVGWLALKTYRNAIPFAGIRLEVLDNLKIWVTK